jgi:peptidoglycan/xylan/chitin deacetylase (PgdA/CDA1 family)
MHVSLRYSLIAAGFAAITASRADRWLASAARGRGVILTLHHVRPLEDRDFAPNQLLEITPEYLDQFLTLVRELGFDVIPLSDVPERLRLAAPKKPFVALTFDDGYRDNLEYGLPVLRRHKAPWTLFVTADYANGGGQLWWLELEEAIRHLERVSLPIEGTMLDLPCGTPAAKHLAFKALYWRLRSGPEDRLRTAIRNLAARAGIDGSELVRALCLGWNELKKLAREPGVTIGAHTITHSMLAKHDEAAAQREIEGSRDVIQRELGVAVSHFSYPVGDVTSAGPREFALAREAGFATAVTTRPGHVFAAHADHLHALPRVSVNGLFQTERAARALLSGVPFLAWNLRRPFANGRSSDQRRLRA